jgi:hypothetical protein
MTRVFLTAVVVCSMLVPVTNASAGQRSRNRGQNKNSQNNNGNQNQNNNVNHNGYSNGNSNQGVSQNGNANRRPKLNAVQQLIQQHGHSQHNNHPVWNQNGGHTNHHQEPAQLDPGRPDGRVEVADVAAPVQTPPPSRPGYVFVNGHWERATANSAAMIGTPTNASVEIRDHRTDQPTNHGARPGTGYYQPTTSDGTTVTDSPPRDLTGQTVYGEGPGLHSLWPIRGFEADNVGVRDHRDKSSRPATPYTPSTLPPPPSIRPPGK